MAILEKESELGAHQTGHNSGVIHAGIYYKPGSLKARLCVEGARLAYDYLDTKNIPYKKVGKLIVACNNEEVARLDELYQRSLANKVPDVRMLHSLEEIQSIEPNCVGLKAIWSPHTGIVDWKFVNQNYGQDFCEAGGQIYTNFAVSSITEINNSENDHRMIIEANDGRQLTARHVITAAGLHADHVARLTGGDATPKIVPFRGEYLVLKPSRSNIVRTNIYPVPDPRFPFLGVHFTPRMDGTMWVGPNAVLAFGREGYTYKDVSPSELLETLLFSGFQRLGWRYLSAGLDEMRRSVCISAQVEQLRRFVPSLKVEDIDQTQVRSGVRAQALDEHGELVDDFVFETDREGVDGQPSRVLHVRNAPSPGATSSLAIAKVIAERAIQQFHLEKSF